MNISDLHKALTLVAPIVGVSIGKPTDKATWRIDFTSEANEAQKTAARSVLNSFDIDAPNQEEIDIANVKIDSAIQFLKTMTPAQAAAWVETNINTLADQKVFNKTVAKILCILARRL